PAQPFVGLGDPGELGVAFMLLPTMAREAWPPGSPRRLGRRLGTANKSLRRAMPARSSVVRTARTTSWRAMNRIWAGTDCGKTHHHCLVLDAEGQTLLSRRVANDEPELLKLISDVLDLADDRDVTWALDMGTTGALLLLTGYQTPAAIRRTGQRRLTTWLGNRKVRNAEALAAKAVEAAARQHTALAGEDAVARMVHTLAKEVLALNEKIAETDKLI